ISAANVGKPSASHLPSFGTGKFTLGKSSINALNVGNSLAKTLTSFDTRDLTLEQGPVSALNMGKPTAGSPVSFTLETGPINAENVGSALRTVAASCFTKECTLEKDLSSASSVLLQSAPAVPH
uniref:Uncharacterized protein n=1 Tax=Castor canadensis TaxID=51338 RepID=A0A8C0ZLY0_CASCN